MRIAQVVAYISDDGAFGGPVAVALAQCVELARQGHEVHLYAAWDGRAKPQAPGVRLHLFKVPRPRLGLTAVLAPWLPLMLLRRRRRFDAVHLHFGRDLTSATSWFAVRTLSVPLVLQPHGMLPPDRRPHARLFDALVVKPALRRAAPVLALTAKEERDLRHVASHNISVQRINNGIAVRDVERAEPAGVPEVLFLARLHPRKQVLVFADAARHLLAEGEQATFRVIGPDEGDLPQLRAFIDRHNLRDSLTYGGAIGPGESTTPLLRASIFVLPSRGEVYPMTVLEAMALGMPIVLSTDCGLSEELGRNRAVLLTNPTPKEVSEAIASLLNDERARTDLGRRARSYVAKHLSVEAVAASLLTHYAAPESSRTT